MIYDSCPILDRWIILKSIFIGMSLYGFLRLGVVPIAMLGWVAYQLFIKKKSFSEFQGDFLAALFMVVVYVLLIYWLMY